MPSKKKTSLNLQKTLDELETIVKELESDDLDVEKSLERFAHGLQLAGAAKERLKEVENKVLEIKKKYEK